MELENGDIQCVCLCECVGLFLLETTHVSLFVFEDNEEKDAVPCLLSPGSSVMTDHIGAPNTEKTIAALLLVPFHFSCLPI